MRTYGKFTALDGNEFHYSDFKESRREAAANAAVRDQGILEVRAAEWVRHLTTPRVVGPCHAGGNDRRASPRRGRQKARIQRCSDLTTFSILPRQPEN